MKVLHTLTVPETGHHWITTLGRTHRRLGIATGNGSARFAHRIGEVRLTWRSGDWYRPYVTARWACGSGSTRPDFVDEAPKGVGLCAKCFPVSVSIAAVAS